MTKKKDCSPSPFHAESVLSYLIQPNSAESFFGRYWETSPFVVSERSGEHYAPLLTRAQLESFLEGEDLRHPPVRLARLGGVDQLAYLKSRSYGHFRVDGLIDSNALFGEFATGASIVIDQANAVFSSLGRCAAALERFTGLRAQASVFLTPANAQSFKVHFDPHGVFVLQVAGKKVWRLFDQPAQWPLLEAFDPEAPPADHQISLEVELVPGDMLYVPRGHFHQVVTTASDSIHISLGVMPLTWIEVLRQAATEFIAEIEFREAPVEQVKAVRDPQALERKWQHLLAKMGQRNPWERIWKKAEERLISRGAMEQHGRIRDILSLAQINETTVVRSRVGLDASIDNHAGQLRLHFNGKSLAFPAGFRPVFEEILSRRRLRATDLSQWIESEDSIELIRLLVREGLLTAAEP